jgi:hypothetical protein
VARIGRQCRGFDCDVGQSRQMQQLRQIIECCVVLRPQERQMVDDEFEFRIMRGDAVDLGQQARWRDHDGEPGTLRLIPYPAGGIIEQCPRLSRVRCDPEPKHSWLIAPIDKRSRLRRRPAHHREAVGMQPCRLQRQIVAVALPGWRHDHHPRDPSGVHLLQQSVLREGLRPMGRTAPSGPRPLRRVGAPDVDLCIDDEHVVLLSFLPSACRLILLSRPPGAGQKGTTRGARGCAKAVRSARAAG